MKNLLIVLFVLVATSAFAQFDPPNYFQIRNDSILPKTGYKMAALPSSSYDGDPTTITQNSTHRFVTDTEKNTWNSKLSTIDSSIWGTKYRIDTSYAKLRIRDADTSLLVSKSGTQTITGAKVFNNAANDIYGIGTNLTALNASNISSGTINIARIPSTIARVSDTSATFASKSFVSTTYVPQSRTINGQPLSSNVTITAESLGISTEDFVAASSPVITGRASITAQYSNTVLMNSSTTTTIDWLLGNNFLVSVIGNCTIYMSNSHDGQIINVSVFNSANHTIAWNGITWTDGIAPEPPSLVEGHTVGVYTFIKVGTYIFGSLKLF